MADLLSTSITGTLNVSQGASITGNLFVSNTDIIPEIAKYSKTLSNLNYDHVNSWYSTKQLLDVNPYGTTPQGIFVKPDGTYLYVLDDTQDNVSQFRLTSAHNVASAVYEGNLKITSADSQGVDLFFSNTGTILYILGDSGNAIDAYDLPTAWNVVAGTTGANTIVAGNTFSVAGNTTNPTGMFMSANGAFLYVANDPAVASDSIIQYNVATPWNVATSVFSASLNLASLNIGFTAPTSVSMNKTGTKMYVLNDGTNDFQYLYQFDLTQPYQIVTATYSGKAHLWSTFSESTGTPETGPTGFFYDPDSNTAYYTGTAADTIRTAKTISGTYILNSIIVDGKVLANNGLEVAEGRPTVLGGALYVSSTSQFYSALGITGSLTGAAASFSGIFTHTSGTGNYGGSTATSIYRLGYGSSTSGTVKTIEIGSSGLTGSNTDITIGTNAGGNSNVTMYGNTTISGNLFVRGIDITAGGSGGGAQGVQGVQGAVGTGNQGVQGVQGAVGTGNQGVQGVQGAVGTGNQGVQGAIGNQGVQGVQGAVGTGNQGVQGAIGNQGVQGVQGAVGTGNQGVQGVQGAVGTGNQGVQGVQGAVGNGTRPWYGNIAGAWADGDPSELLKRCQTSGTVAATPTFISITVARIAYFKLPQTMIVNKIRYYGVGATTNVYRIAIYNADTLARVLTETAFTTTLSGWGSIGTSLNLTLTGGQLYFIACSVNAVGTTPGVLCFSPTITATTGQIAVLPKIWPGNLDIDAGYTLSGLAQGAVTTGALPDPFPTVAAQAAWSGGMPAFWLDNSNL